MCFRARLEQESQPEPDFSFLVRGPAPYNDLQKMTAPYLISHDYTLLTMANAPKKFKVYLIQDIRDLRRTETAYLRHICIQAHAYTSKSRLRTERERVTPVWLCVVPYT